METSLLGGFQLARGERLELVVSGRDDLVHPTCRNDSVSEAWQSLLETASCRYRVSAMDAVEHGKVVRNERGKVAKLGSETRASPTAVPPYM